VDDDEVIADGVEAVAVDPLPLRLIPRGGAPFLVEDTVAEPLTGFDLAGAGRLTQDQIAAPGGNVWRIKQRPSLLARCLPQTPGIGKLRDRKAARSCGRLERAELLAVAERFGDVDA
jgi:hypothetical protein